MPVWGGTPGGAGSPQGKRPRSVADGPSGKTPRSDSSAETRRGNHVGQRMDDGIGNRMKEGEPDTNNEGEMRTERRGGRKRNLGGREEGQCKWKEWYPLRRENSGHLGNWTIAVRG